LQLGISSFAAIKQPLNRAESDLTGLGVGVEVMCEPPHAWPAPVPWANGRPLSLHMPILGINIASTNPGIREESVRQGLQTIEEAARLGAAGVVVHPGAPPFEAIMPRDRGLPFAIESVCRLAEAAAAAGVEVYLENMPAIIVVQGARPFPVGYGVEYEELRHIYDSVDHPSVRLCLDLGHAFLAGRAVLDAMLRDEDVVHVHANDNRGMRDDHLAWGDGEISKVVNLPHDLPASVRTLVFEVESVDACRRSLERTRADSLQRRERT
jgi:sugar phosphate isomerase/epimerase